MAGGARLSPRQKLKLRCNTIAEVVRALAPVHSRSEHATQIDLLETLIGASIWYLPTLPKELWTGTISIGAIESCSPTSGNGPVRLSQEHVVPRKIAACRLLAHPRRDDAEFPEIVEQMFFDELGKFRYVTTSENKRLVAHQRKEKYTNPDAAYEQAGVRFLSISPDELRQLRRRDAATVTRLLSQRGPDAIGSHK